MFELKPLHPEAIPAALAKAERYRLLNEASEAESICLDVLHVDPDNQQALIVMLLAITDQFADAGTTGAVARAQALLSRLRDPYERAYYAGIICERRAKARANQAGPHFGAMAYDWFREAMAWFEKAEAIRPPGNDDAILRWNTCARILMRDPHLKPAVEEYGEPLQLE